MEIIEPTAAVPPTKAPSYPDCAGIAAGEQATCRIVLAACSYMPKVKGSPTFCNDAPYPNHGFTYLVWGRDLSELNGRCIIVSGQVVMYKGKLEIEAQNTGGLVGYCDE
jgi:hypothetical protein